MGAMKELDDGCSAKTSSKGPVRAFTKIISGLVGEQGIYAVNYPYTCIVEFGQANRYKITSIVR